jgi:hypothetical protein
MLQSGSEEEGKNVHPVAFAHCGHSEWGPVLTFTVHF